MDCTFDHDWCNFFHDDTANFEWERTNTATTSGNTGPGFGKIELCSYMNRLFFL